MCLDSAFIVSSFEDGDGAFVEKISFVSPQVTVKWDSDIGGDYLSYIKI